MKALKKSVLFILLLALFTVCVCVFGQDEADGSFFSGKWGYIHDPKTAVLSFRKDKAEYKGVKYSYTADDTYLYLTAGETTLSLRYLISGKHFYIFEPTQYQYAGASAPEGLAGKWVNPNKWSFEFSANGQFIEDGYFPGSYISDENTFKLMYTDHFEDTTCYYKIDGNVLTVEYPWEMARPD